MGSWPSPAPGPKRSGKALTLVIVMVAAFMVLLGGGALYLATISNGRYPRAPYACGLVLPSEVALMFGHGLPSPSPSSSRSESGCQWSNLLAYNAKLERSVSFLNLRVKRFSRGVFSSADDRARNDLSDRPRPAAVPRRYQRISGYGDVSLRLIKVYSGTYDAIEFKVGNLVVEVAAEQKNADGDEDPNQSWATTQRAAGIIARRLSTMPPRAMPAGARQGGEHAGLFGRTS